MARSSDAVELLLVPGSHDDYGDVTRHLAQLGDFIDRTGFGEEAHLFFTVFRSHPHQVFTHAPLLFINQNQSGQVIGS